MRCYDELLTSFQRTMQNQYPDIAFTLVPIDRYSKSQVELFQLMSEHRYFLQLSPIEGFGLTPLEAMGCGCLALGFHGSGGLEYMLPSGLRRNCATVAYPQMEKLCKNVALMLSKPGKAKKIATRGMPLIQKYSRNVFEKRWIEFFHKIIDCF
jgi:glycosyltransferase involved in cell wall biosynthesis